MLNTDHAKTASGVADYQPAWEHDYDIKLLRTVLAHTAPLVSPEDIDMLRGILRDAPRDSLVLQVGDCVEDLSEATTEAAEQKSEAIVTLGSALKHQPGGVLLLGRIAGQYAKPRSTPYETANGETFMSFRGPIVHDSRRSSRHRAGNAHRIATCHLASQTTAHAVSTYDATPFLSGRIWTSHEALLLDYEMPLVRELDGKRYATSAAWPWIGNRTRGFTGPHIAFAEQITNPISVKIGPDLTPQDLVYLARTLNPTNDPGRLTFIARYGRNRIGELAPLVRASKNEGISARWMTDPMHGNTFTNHQGMKTRLLEAIVDEAVGFSQILRYEGVPVGGIHLETTPGPIQECVWQQDEQIDSGKYTTGCDPRLTTPQAQYVLERWELA